MLVPDHGSETMVGYELHAAGDGDAVTDLDQVGLGGELHRIDEAGITDPDAPASKFRNSLVVGPDPALSQQLP
jgi:hypothetical protein